MPRQQARRRSGDATRPSSDRGSAACLVRGAVGNHRGRERPPRSRSTSIAKPDPRHVRAARGGLPLTGAPRRSPAVFRSLKDQARGSEILHHHRHLLSERRPAHRSRLRGDRHRRASRASSGSTANDVFFLTGTDEHGLKMKQTAAKEGVSPSELADRNAAAFQRDGEALGLLATTTSSAPPRSATASRAEEIWRRMARKPATSISKNYAGWYSVRDEDYYAEGETEVGDDGVRRATDGHARRVDRGGELLLPPLAPIRTRCSRTTRRTRTSSPPDAPQRGRQLRQGGAEGPLDLAHRRSTGAFRFPGDPEHVMYVWVDALTNYITGAGFPDEQRRSCEILAGRHARHRQGHHPLPRRLLAGVPDVGRHRTAEARLRARLRAQQGREDVEVGRQRASTRSHSSTAYGLDPVRYFFLREVPFGQDGNYSHEAIVNRINADLANDLGNLAQRSLSMIAKNSTVSCRPGRVHGCRQCDPGAGRRALCRRSRAMDRQAIKGYLDAVWALIAEGDRYFASEKPFDKTLSTERKGTILYVTAEIVRQMAILAQPAMPASGVKLLELLGAARARALVCFIGRERPLEARDLAARAAGRLPALRRAEGRDRRSRAREAARSRKSSPRARRGDAAIVGSR